MEITEELLIRGRRELEHAKQMRQPRPFFISRIRGKIKLEIILKSRGLHLQLNDTSAEQILNLAAVSRALDVSHSHLRQLIFRGMSVSDALNYLVNEKKGCE